MEYIFKDVLDVKNGKNQREVECPDGQYPIYGSGGVMGYANDYICEADTVIIGRKGSINNPIYAEEPFWNVDTAFGLCAKKDILLPKYLFYFCIIFDFERLNRTVTIPSLTKSDLLKIKIQVPSLDVQQEVIDKLTKIESILNFRKQELKLLDELVRGRFVELFGDPKHEEKYKGIPLRELCMTVSGGTPSTKFPEYYKGNIPWISTVSLGPDHIDGSTAKGYITQEAIENSATKLIPTGNILFGTRVGVGKSSLNDVDICTNQDIVAIIGIDENRFSRLFIKHVLDAYQSYFDSIKKGATILGITGDDLKDTLIPDAPLSIQREYEKFVEQINKSKLIVQKELDETQLLFDSLMQEYFG